QIVAALDRHEAGGADLRKYVLKNADAAATARLLTALLKTDQPTPRRDEAPKKEPTDQGLRGRVTAVADDRTNTLFVTAPGETLKVIDGIVKDLEADPAVAS